MQCKPAEFLVGAELEKAIDDIVKLIMEWSEVSGRAFSGQVVRAGATLPAWPTASPPSRSTAPIVRPSDAHD
jgi:hypothetical protein